MMDSLQKRWVFTWNACENNKLPSAHVLQAKLNLIAAEAVFLFERSDIILFDKLDNFFYYPLSFLISTHLNL